VAPRSLDEAVGQLMHDGARPLAGGTDLLVQMRHGLRVVDLVVDVKGVPELNVLEYEAERGLTVGAAVPCYRIYQDQQVRAHYPGLVDAASIIGGTAIQSRATLGGNLCNASPSGDTIPIMIALGVEALLRGPEGERSVPVEAICTGPGETILHKGELLVALRFPPPVPHAGARYLRFTPRNEMDLAIAGAGAWVMLNADGEMIEDARVALGAVAPRPLYVSAIGKHLRGKRATEETIAEAARLARDAAQPVSDVRGSVAQRVHLAGVLTRRALWGAIRRARGEAIHVESSCGDGAQRRGGRVPLRTPPEPTRVSA
jgi:carbon-monoxide dehydrogenase medium subunit